MIAAASEAKEERPVRMARRAARLAAVQAVYQMEQTGADAEAVIEEFVAHRFGHEAEVSPAGVPEKDFFADLVRGVPHRQTEIDRAVLRALSANWKLQRIDSILRAILRVAAYELVGRPDVPARVAIDEYVEIAHAFFEGEEVGFVNAILDRLAREKRVSEFSETPGDDEREI